MERISGVYPLRSEIAIIQAKVARWGNSLAVRLPADLVRELGLAEGQVLELKKRDAVIEMTPPAARRYFKGIPVYTMEELLADMDRLGPDAEPPTIDWGPDRGSEIIDDAYSRGEITDEDLMNGTAKRR